MVPWLPERLSTYRPHQLGGRARVDQDVRLGVCLENAVSQPTGNEVEDLSSPTLRSF